MDAEAANRLSQKMVEFLETGTAPEGLFRPDVFLDLSMPTWRVQTRGAEDLEQVRKDGHPGPGTVTRWRSDPTPDRAGLRVRGAVEPRGPAVVRPGDDADGRRRTAGRRRLHLLHRRLGRGPPARARRAPST